MIPSLSNPRMRHALISSVAAILLLQGIWADVTGNDDSPNQDWYATVLCSFPGYDVRYVINRDVVWVSTTVFSQSVRTALSTANERLRKYAAWNSMAGETFQLSMPVVTQAFLPSTPKNKTDFTYKREFTVSVPLPTALRDNPPQPLDPLVVLDVVPDTLMYVRKFNNIKGGFIVDKEAKKFFRDLKDAGEPYWSDDDYFYVVQYPRGYTEMFIFASNARVDRFYRQSEGPDKARLHLPKCLRKTGFRWAMPTDRTDDVRVTARSSCRPDFCNHPDCLDYTVLDTYKDGVETRRYSLLHSISTYAPTCYYQQTSALNQPVLNLHLKAPGLMNLSGEFRMMDQEARTVIQVKEGEGHCHKQFKSFAVVPRTSAYQTKGWVDLDYVKNPERVNREDLYLKNYYVKCFGGPGDSATVFDMARRLGDHLLAKDCRLANNFHVNEYNRQSRLFDRRNEIWYSDELCKPGLKTWLEGFLSVPGSDNSVISSALAAGSPGWTAEEEQEEVTITFDHEVDRTRRTLPLVLEDECSQHECAPFDLVRTFDRFVEKYSGWEEDPAREDDTHRHKSTDGTKSPRRGGVECFFPFLYQGQLFHECTTVGFRQSWCAWDAVFDIGHWSYCDQATKELDGSIQITSRQYSTDLADPMSSDFTAATSEFETQMESALGPVLGAELQSVAVRGYGNTAASGNLRVDFTLVVNSNVTLNTTAWSVAMDAGEGGTMTFESSSLTLKGTLT
ncbi:uncharacterized protein [Branchiostoma lanceolatum]|uniref:uncharacterized protein n=1 Tax=Branchiostoma lanceolatum TaxID=7740 RepID=UPI0034557C74